MEWIEAFRLANMKVAIQLAEQNGITDEKLWHEKANEYKLTKRSKMTWQERCKVELEKLCDRVTVNMVVTVIYMI